MPGCALTQRVFSPRSRPAVVAALAPAPAGAKIIEIGMTAPNPPSARPTPARPSPARPATRPRSAPSAGCSRSRPTARSSRGRSGSARPAKRQIKFFNDNFGGASPAGISILKPRHALFRRVAGAEPAADCSPTSATTVQFPLGTRAERQEGQRHRPDRPDLGARPGPRAGDDTSWRASRAREGVRRHGHASPRSSTSGAHAVPLPVPDGAPDLLRDADHRRRSRRSGAELRTREDVSRLRRSPGRTARTSPARSPRAARVRRRGPRGGRRGGGRVAVPVPRVAPWRRCCRWCPSRRAGPASAVPPAVASAVGRGAVVLPDGRPRPSVRAR